VRGAVIAVGVSTMMIAAEQHIASEVFTVGGRRYQWLEGAHALAPHAGRWEARRAQLGELFARVILPGLERRGAKRRVLGAGPRGGSARAHWVEWRAPGDAQPVWALYVPTRRLGARALEDLGRPANDGAMLAAWGDGPVLAWVSERPGARVAVREALRALPEFLARGVASADVTLPVRVVGLGETAAL
jgi:hypothetical protein